MKKLIYLTTAVAAMAGAAMVDAKAPEGFYGTVGVDGAYLLGRTKVDTERLNIAANMTDKSTTDLGPKGGAFGVFLGGMYVTDSAFFVGLDVSGSWGSATAKHDDKENDFKITFKQKENYGVNASLGAAFDVAQPYVKFGYVRGKLRGEVDGDVNTYNIGYGKEEKWESGFLLGLGADFCVSEGLFIGAAFNHVWYSDFNLTSNGTQPKKLKMKVESDEMRVRLKYAF